MASCTFRVEARKQLIRLGCYDHLPVILVIVNSDAAKRYLFGVLETIRTFGFPFSLRLEQCKE